MLPKKNRADRKIVENIFKKGRFLTSPSLSFKFTPTTGLKKISVIVPKSVSKSAVTRNLLRRRGYSALKKYFNLFPTGISGAVVLKSAKVTILTLEKEIKEILSKLK